MNIINAIILLSSGLDCVTALAMTVKSNIRVKLALTFDYGQKASSNELLYSSKIAQYYKINHRVISLPWLKEITQTGLVNESVDLPSISLDDISSSADSRITQNSAKNVWVPNRNGVMINIAASFAESMDYDYIIVGFNAEEALTFPDNSIEYVNALNLCLNFSTLNKVKMLAPVAQLNKQEIILRAVEMQAPLHLSWTCYNGGNTPCGTCESCTRRIRAFKEQGITDPFTGKNEGNICKELF